jgi:GNAT superfamily N-acetyltransferase
MGVVGWNRGGPSNGSCAGDAPVLNSRRPSVQRGGRTLDKARERANPTETAPDPPRVARTPDDEIVPLLHHPERLLVPEVAAYPAHLHIVLLPQWQGRGYGRALMLTFLDALHRAGVPAVHLSMVTANAPARAFYDRLGFHEIDVPDADATVTYLGRPTAWR